MLNSPARARQFVVNPQNVMESLTKGKSRMWKIHRLKLSLHVPERDYALGPLALNTNTPDSMVPRLFLTDGLISPCLETCLSDRFGCESEDIVWV